MVYIRLDYSWSLSLDGGSQKTVTKSNIRPTYHLPSRSLLQIPHPQRPSLRSVLLDFMAAFSYCCYMTKPMASPVRSLASTMHVFHISAVAVPVSRITEMPKPQECSRIIERGRTGEQETNINAKHRLRKEATLGTRKCIKTLPRLGLRMIPRGDNPQYLSNKRHLRLNRTLDTPRRLPSILPSSN